MRKLATGIWVALGTAGGIMTVAAQTKPEDAISNLGAWAKLLGLKGASLPASVDAWATGIGIAMMAAALGVWAWKRRQAARANVAALPQPESPIGLHDGLFVDCDHVKKLDSGETVETVYSVALCLWVTNGLGDGAVLRNLQARYYFPDGNWAVLPIRNCANSLIDLRHGEVAIFEIGRMLWRQPKDTNTIPAAPRTSFYQTIDDKEADHLMAPEAHWRSLKISSATGDSRHSIGQSSPETPFSWMRIVLSADGVVSRHIQMSANLYAENAHEWLIFIQPDAKDA